MKSFYIDSSGLCFLFFMSKQLYFIFITYLQLIRTLSSLKVAFLFLIIFFCTNSYGLNVSDMVKVEGEQCYDIALDTDSIIWLKTNSSQDSVPTIDGASYAMVYEEGMPELQQITYSFFDPSITSYSVEVLEIEYDSLAALLPISNGFVSKDDTTVMEQNYVGKNVFFPSSDYYLSDEFISGDQHLRVLHLYPFQYNACTHILRYITHLKLRVHYEQEPLSKAVSVEKRKKLLILAPQSFHKTLASFVLWKEICGYDTELIDSDVLVDAAAIKQYLQDMYDSGSLDYLLLVGDAEIIPTSATIYGSSDNCYGFLDGNDSFNDIGIGRFPASTQEELALMIEKSLCYEQQFSFNDKLLKCVGIASNATTIGDNNETDFQHISTLLETLAVAGYATDIVAEDMTDLSISQLINDDLGLLFYAGHGSQVKMKTETYSEDSILNLRNYMSHPIFIDVACLNGDFTYDDCIAEKFMTASYNNQPTGMVAVLASTISQPWIPPMYGQDVIANAFARNAKLHKVTTLSDVVNEGLSAMIIKYSSGGIETSDTWSLLGDPTLLVANYEFGALNVVADSLFDLRQCSIAIATADSALLSLNNQDGVLAASYSNSDSTFLYSSVVSIKDDLCLWAYKQGSTVFRELLTPVITGGAYYGLDSLIIVDENQNGAIEAGEQLFVYPVIANYGDSVGYGIQMAITPDDNFSTEPNAFASIDSLSPNETFAFSTPLVLIVNDSVGDEAFLSFEYVDAQGQMNLDVQSLEVLSSNVTFGTATYKDASMVSGVSVFKDSIITLYIPATNSGEASAMDIYGEVHSASPFLTYISQTDGIDELPPNTTDTLTFQLRCHPAIPISELLDIDLLAMHGEDRYDKHLQLCYQQAEVSIVGTGEIELQEAPFFNYYKNNKSQFVYTLTNETAITLDSLGFYLTHTPSLSGQTVLNDLSISVAQIPDSSVGFQYLEGTEEVFYQSVYQMPTDEGWLMFDISDIELTAQAHLLLQVTWGPNSVCTQYNNAYKVSAYKTTDYTTLTGYSDVSSSPNISNRYKALPDLRYTMNTETRISRVITVCETSGECILDYSLGIGTELCYPDNNGYLHLDLPVGDYEVSVTTDDGRFDENLLVSAYQDSLQIVLPTSRTALDELYDASFIDVSLQNGILYFSNEEAFYLELFDLNGRKIFSDDIHTCNFQMAIDTKTLFIMCRINHHNVIKLFNN